MRKQKHLNDLTTEGKSFFKKKGEARLSRQYELFRTFSRHSFLPGQCGGVHILVKPSAVAAPRKPCYKLNHEESELRRDRIDFWSKKFNYIFPWAQH